jgi:hypothetical protein
VVACPCWRSGLVKSNGFTGGAAGQTRGGLRAGSTCGYAARQAGLSAGKARAAMSRNREILYVGTGRFVAAVDAKTGEEIWRTKLPHAMGNIVTIILKDGRLYVGHAGRAYGLNLQDGTIMWENGLAGMGLGAVLMAMEGAQGCTMPGAVAAAEAEARAAQAHTSST